jgi:hypothetical protein
LKKNLQEFLEIECNIPDNFRYWRDIQILTDFGFFKNIKLL